jgi:MarR family transcriptional regulator, 2-MHQ and catechol-resistance regulon repressor
VEPPSGTLVESDLAAQVAACPGGAGGPSLAGVDDPRIQLMGLLVEAHIRLSRVLGAELESACGVPLHWYDVLIRLGRSTEHRLTMTELASQTLLSSGGMTRLVDRIAEAGYVERQNCPSDRRSVYVALTPAGTHALEVGTAQHLEGLERHLLGPLDEVDREALRVALGKLVGEAPICGSQSDMAS